MFGSKSCNWATRKWQRVLCKFSSISTCIISMSSSLVCIRLCRDGFRTKKNFLLFFGLYLPDLARNNPKMIFLVFWIFVLFFFEFSRLGCVGTDSERIFFLLFFGLSHLVLVRNKPKMMFYNSLNFYTVFLEFSKPGCVGTNSEWNFFSSLFWLFPSRFC